LRQKFRYPRIFHKQPIAFILWPMLLYIHYAWHCEPRSRNTSINNPILGHPSLMPGTGTKIYFVQPAALQYPQRAYRPLYARCPVSISHNSSRKTAMACVRNGEAQAKP
jgi:hypothetical protein